ncbi:MAG TPA: tyrosine-type recombinase/integrase [Ktedonobacterales bacterium]|jgi:integrase/recombinase XerD
MAKAPIESIKSLEQLSHAYLDDLEVRAYKPKTIGGYAKNLHTFVTWAAGEGATTLHDFTAEFVKAYIRYLQHKPKYAERHYTKYSDELVTAAAIRNYVRDIKAFASWLAAEHYTPTNVLASVRLPKADETPIEPFSDEALACIFGYLNPADAFDLRDYVVLHLLWDTGMRVGELVNLTLDDVDLKSCQIRIQHAKFGKWRDIGFGRETHKYLTRYLSLCRPEPAIASDRHLLLCLDGYPMMESTVQHMCARLSKRVGIHVHAHRFRHTFAVNMLRVGTDLRTLQRLMGHADIRILSRYLNLASDEAIKTHQTNSPADRYRQQHPTQARRLPIRRPW